MTAKNNTSGSQKLAEINAVQKTIPNGVKFAFGGLAGQVTFFYRVSTILFAFRMGATLFVQPLDLLKNRLQMSGTAGKKEYVQSLIRFVYYRNTKLKYSYF